MNAESNASTLITREEHFERSAIEYAANGSGSKSHHEYYSQFVTPEILALVQNKFGKDSLKEAFAKDEHFNTIPLRQWDNLAGWQITHSQGSENYHLSSTYVRDLIGKDKLTAAGEGYSCGTGVCVLKAAARILIEQD